MEDIPLASDMTRYGEYLSGLHFLIETIIDHPIYIDR